MSATSSAEGKTTVRARRGITSAPEPRPRAMELVGHDAAREEVAATLESGGLAPVLLVTGPKGVGKEAFAFWVARRLLCSAAESRPCGACPACARIAALGHPDVHWFFPVPAESAFGESEWAGLLERIRRDPLDPALRRFTQPASFRMHQAAAIRRLSATKPFEGGGQVFVLGDYEQNPSDHVHNALLKVLEEPPPRTTFVLTTCRLQGLPPTILSRCRRIRLAPLAPLEMESFLDAVAERREGGIARERRADLVALAEGSPGRALDLIYGKDVSGAEAAHFLDAVVAGGSVASYGYALTSGFRGSREDHGRRLDALAALWRDVLRVAAGADDAVARPDLRDLYRHAAERLDPGRGAAAALEIERAREQVQANVYAPLVFWKLFRALALALESARPSAPAPAR